MQETFGGMFPFASLEEVSKQNMALFENAMKAFFASSDIAREYNDACRLEPAIPRAADRLYQTASAAWCRGATRLQRSAKKSSTKLSRRC